MKLKRIATMLSIVALSVGLFMACSDDDNPNPKPGGPNPKPDYATKVSTSVNGFVTNENDEPFAGVIIKAGTQTTQTGLDGYFEINDAELVKEISVIHAEAPGYFRGIRTWMGYKDETAFVKIKLLPKEVIGTINNSNGGEVKTKDGLKLKFPAGGVMTASGEAYTGDVLVAAKWLDPSSVDILTGMPGDLRAVDSDGDIMGLITYGMVAAELTSPAGDLLQVATGKTVGMTAAIPASMQSDAPSEMPLWFFDEAKGMWIEEGKAVREGNEYVGDLSHFSWWNIDVPYPYVTMTCYIVDSNGNPIANTPVRVKTNTNNVGYAYSNGNGKITAYVPNNTSNLLLEVYSPVTTILDCVILQHTFNTGTEKVDLGTLTANNAQIKSSQISGTLLNCDGKEVVNGRVALSINGTSFSVNVVDGAYSMNVLYCNAANYSVDIVGYNNDDNTTKVIKHSAQLVLGTNLVVPPLEACDVTNYLTVSLNNGPKTVLNDSDDQDFFYFRRSSNGSGTSEILSFYGRSNSLYESVEFEWDIPVMPIPGVYPISEGYYSGEGLRESALISGTVSITNISKVAVDDYRFAWNMKGEYTMVVRDAERPGTTGTISGSFYYVGEDLPH